MNRKVFDQSKPLIGVLQLLPLPGASGWNGRIDQVIARAEQEASALATGGVDAILVENTGDSPYATERMDSAGAIAMGLIVKRMMHFTRVPIGVSVLKNDPETALAIAMNVGARFIRVGLLTGAAISESGILQGKYRELETYRKQLQVEGIAVYADVSVEKTIPLLGSIDNSNPITLASLAKQAVTIGGADGVILSDRNLTPDAISTVREHIDAPIFIDYHNPLDQASPYLQASDGLVVSSVLKKAKSFTPDQTPTVDLNKVEELSSIASLVR